MVFRALSDLVLPERCASCAAFGRCPLCDACTRRIDWIDEACERCAAPKPRRRACGECATRHHVFTRAASAAIYHGPVRDAIVAFKLLGERRAAREFAQWLLKPARRLERPDAITWVPSTRAGESDRGFTPAKEIARAFARLTNMGGLALLEKVSETPDQAGLTGQERLANFAGAFRARRLPPETVLLVDDILTTGATADACASALKEAGAGRIDVLTVARAPLRRTQGIRRRIQGDFTISGAPLEG